MWKSLIGVGNAALLIALAGLIGFNVGNGQTAQTSSPPIASTTIGKAMDTKTQRAPDAEAPASPVQLTLQAQGFMITFADKPSFAPVATAGVTTALDAQDGSNAKSAGSDQSSGQPDDPSTAPQGAPPSGAPPIEVLTSKQKIRYGLKQAFYTPGSYIGPAFGAGFRQFDVLDVPAKTQGDKVVDYLSDYAKVFGTASTTELFGAGIYPALFKQNPKYTKLKDISGGSASRGARLFYALGNAVVTTGDNGNRQVNISRLGGNLTGAALSNIWERDTPKKRDRFGVVTDTNRRRGAGATFKQFGFAVGFDALANVLEEFFGFGR